jgi:hypothetical protein
METAMPMDKEMEKKRKAMQKRLSALGPGNPIIKEAIKRMDPKESSWEKFEIVEKLVSGAREKFEATGNFGECMKNLGEAISKLATNNTSKKDEDEDL